MSSLEKRASLLGLIGIQNRVTAHSATLDWTTGERRHLGRITPQAERPYETPYVPEDRKGQA